VVVLLATGCGGGNGAAESITLYIEDVNALQRELAIPLDFVARANRDLRAGRNLAALRPKLDRSVRTIGKLERRLEALEPPPEAKRLDKLLREIVHEERELAAEFAALAKYALAAAAPLARAAAAGTRARQELAASRGDPKGQAAALERYAVSLDATTRTLRKLKPPPVVAADQRIQVRSYAQIAATSRSLAAALREGSGVDERLRGLERAVASGSTLRAQRTRAAAVRAFNRRVVHVKELGADAQRERLRLQRQL
jgi:hypothetical protein